MKIQSEPALPTQIKRNDVVVVGFQVIGGAGESGRLSNPEISRTPAIPSPRGLISQRAAQGVKETFALTQMLWTVPTLQVCSDLWLIEI